MRPIIVAILLALGITSGVSADELVLRSCKFFDYLTGKQPATMVSYTPSQLDPRRDSSYRRVKSSSIRADLEKLRPAFDGLILYGYHEACTPRILAIAQDLKFRAVLLGVWDPKSAAEMDGVAELANTYSGDFALGVIIGHEGLTFNRYEEEDLVIAARRLRAKLPVGIPYSTSEPLVIYQSANVSEFGDFLAPNIHPVFDRPEMTAEEAAQWVRGEAAALSRRSDRPVFVKETGFPHSGRGRYTPELQADFWRRYTEAGLIAKDSAQNWRFHGAAHEAFDAPWKGTEDKADVEKSWGFLTADRAAFPALSVWADLRAAAR